ncbi:MAG: bifunctional lysine ketoglutarate reductase /saccharopine dehydrogenase family protein [Chloroflexota bacterium]|nr:bifunctional lysine ketoglutarate reductase /saccharopine dehydrogenase family protein [Chloroflexota bacterium]
MNVRIGVRREDKSRWERRVPVTPDDARRLKEEHGIEVWVQPSPIRIFAEKEFTQAGALVQEDISACPVTFAVKEIPLDFFKPGQAYIFFSHVIKGQPSNMPMLKKMLELGCTLIDYEKVTDEKGRRLIFFGRHAGLAGIIESFWALGKRLDWEGISNPFNQLRHTYEYNGLAEVKEAVSQVGEDLKAGGLPESVTPLICGVAGYGNVARGVEEILDLLPIKEIEPGEIASLVESSNYNANVIYKAVFKEEHTVEPISPQDSFELQDFYDHPEKYRGKFENYVPYLTMIVNCIYWDVKYPRLITKEYLERLYGAGKPRLRVIGDISCDVEGAIECTVHYTEADKPVFVYNPFTGEATDGYEGEGPVVMAVDILPSQLPRDASIYFSGVLGEFIPTIARADYTVPFEQLNLPPEIKRAVIAHRGKLAPDYGYIEQYL